MNKKQIAIGNKMVAFFRTIKSKHEIPGCYNECMIVHYREQDDKYVILRSPDDGHPKEGLSLDSLYGLLIKYGINIDAISAPCGLRGIACKI